MTDTQFEQNLKKYADVLVRVGVNITEGDLLLLTVTLTGDEATQRLAHYVIESAYAAGAKYVDVNWTDPMTGKLRALYANEDTLDFVPEWRLKMVESYAEAGVARLVISGRDPQLMAGVDRKRIMTVQRATQKAFEPFRAKLIDENVWCGASVPVQAWADKIFTDAPEDERITKLWDAIFAATRVYEDDPVAAWQAHQADLMTRRKVMNDKQYTALHFSGDGTDLTVGLPKGHIWQGGASKHATGKLFTPNIPTEEMFTMPHRDRVNGTVRATKPLSYIGNLIDDFSMTFEDGRVTDFTAGQGGEVLQDLLDTDEGARHLGEVALVPHSSPISQTGMLFFNTLYDENAASHIALGRAYAMTIENGTEMSEDEFVEAGGNTSQTHVDFMIGSEHIDIDGITVDGKREPVMRKGEWAFEVE
ncbi:MAG: aminopeptidase [Chloroflexota bacterium]